MASVNRVIIVGRLGRDPELRYTQSGTAVCSLSVATDESYTDRDGNKVDRTEWHRISCFQKQAENCANFLTKGSLVYVEGSLTTRKWQDQQGQDRYTTESRPSACSSLTARATTSAEQTSRRAHHGSSQRQGVIRRDSSRHRIKTT